MGKKVKREAEDDDLETKTNLKKQKKEVIETMEGLVDHLKRIESKFDLLATKVDQLISVKGESVHVKKSLKAKAEISSSEDESSSSDEDSMDSSSSESEDDSSSSDDEESDQGEKAEVKTAKIPKNESSNNVDSTNDEKESECSFRSPTFGYVSRSGRWPFAGGRFSGGRCGGQGFCGRC
ncbi:unnamed protein product [Eruca vesicaria subsp. sativa]|uniref:Uncharacterized protein n=1 Tax=Eruca vesicaria subsp. sativa TaxID=29727 RepID=A0ABC8JWD2_ERUVS|nr:unnamed protein product [Eruca vesicaria subsp. sativa]